ncbi:MAG TPA: ABC transporter permease [Bacteroidales bacterium]|nr:ABC transporter permease [Bacteroidales bacterium]HQI69903.1 ABC transporter permease [Bacteroidales bacterium]
MSGIKSALISPFRIILILLGSLILLFLIAPIAGMFLATTVSDIFESAKDTEVRDSIWLTLFTAMGATLFTAIGAIPLAYILARKDFKLKRFVLGLIDLPIVIPHSAAGIAILGFISRDTAMGKFASNFGIDLVGHPAGISIAMAFVSLPFLINAARDGFISVPVRLEKAALVLGASPIRIFFSISLPLAWKNIVSGLIMMFARGMSEFGAVVIVAYHPMVTPVLIFERFGSFGLSYARPAAVLFILVSLLFFVVLRLLTKTKNA